MARYSIPKKIGAITFEHHLDNVQRPRGGLSREEAAARFDDCEFMSAGRMGNGARKRSAGSRAQRAGREIGGMAYNHRELAGRAHTSQVKAAAVAPRLAAAEWRSAQAAAQAANAQRRVRSVEEDNRQHRQRREEDDRLHRQLRETEADYAAMWEWRRLEERAREQCAPPSVPLPDAPPIVVEPKSSEPKSSACLRKHLYNLSHLPKEPQWAGTDLRAAVEAGWVEEGADSDFQLLEEPPEGVQFTY